MIVQDLVDAMETIAPLKLREEWDKVGLQLGDPKRTLTGPILLTIDLTERVLQEAIDAKASAIVAYHPPIFSPLESLTDRTHSERIIRGCAEAGIAIYTPHTALDAAHDGVTDWLCEGVSAPAGEAQQGMIHGDCRALIPATGGDRDREVKVITFVPNNEVDHLRGALGTAGAGGMGNYKLCSFSTVGEGTFLPDEGANPTIGKVGSLERVKETRIEMVCSRRALALVIETLKEFHPYETPAYDIVELVPEPIRRIGSGRRLVLDRPADIKSIADRLKHHLDRSRIRYALAPGHEQPNHVFETIAVVPGSGGSLWHDARDQGCELFVTGEMTHHHILAARQSGISILLAGHTNTERGYLPRLKAKLAAQLPDASLVMSTSDHDHITVG
ncbi:MAG: Nif3-like dinuclear metal center hexameric protein [Phycisphaerae bacterium]|nr:Nif3-like dinuclear metal center hexameric protein [Phycisphaerae bacterium]MBM92040.1 Nif3-like dinuclear metal center hexameric protein [Phycisphaerae bacterium]HCT45323.1 Nif3-like dinuclear metal center hexameric protein [Phycisphaerales bacterium]